MSARGVVLLALALASSAGCVDRDAPPPPPAPKPSDASMAYRLGHKLGVIQGFEIMSAPVNEKEALADADAFARALGVTEPTITTDWDPIQQRIGEELVARKSRQVAASYAVGYAVAYADLRAVLATSGTAADDIGLSPQVADLEGYLPETGIPASVWRAPLATVRAVPRPASVEALDDALSEYLGD
jgi:hypothetical protein